MRFMSLVKSHENHEAGKPPSPELMAAIGKLGEEMFRTGKMVEMGGLLPSARGARLRVDGGEVTVTDGPFAEAKELIGGYAILQTESKAEAVELARRFLQVHVDVLGPAYTGELELRQLAEIPE